MQKLHKDNLPNFLDDKRTLLFLHDGLRSDVFVTKPKRSYWVVNLLIMTLMSLDDRISTRLLARKASLQAGDIMLQCIRVVFERYLLSIFPATKRGCRNLQDLTVGQFTTNTCHDRQEFISFSILWALHQRFTSGNVTRPSSDLHQQRLWVFVVFCCVQFYCIMLYSTYTISLVPFVVSMDSIRDAFGGMFSV